MMEPAKASALIALVLGTVVVAKAMAGCGESAQPLVDAQSSPPESGVLDAKRDPLDASSDSSQPGGDVPPGWEPVAGYPSCPLSAPTPTTMPAPIAWTACPSTVETAGLQCQMVDTNWVVPIPRLNDTDLAGSKAVVLDSGAVLLSHARRYQGYTMWIHGEIDGPVRAAVSAPRAASCDVSPQPSDGAHVLYYGAGVNGTGKALVGALDGTPPKVVYDQLPTVNLYSAPAGFVVLSTASIQLRAWTDGALLKVLSDGATGQLRHVVVAGNVIAFADTGGRGGASYLSGLTSATTTFAAPDAGGTTGVGDLGSDGKEWVWNEGSGGLYPGTQLWTNVQMVATPFTADPAEARAKKRVIWSGSGNGASVLMGSEPYVVGCGYAARHVGMSENGVNRSGYLVTRLTDGHAQLLVGSSAAGPLPFTFVRVLAVTCDEVIALASVRYDGGFRSTVARVKISTLPSVTLPLPPGTFE